MTLRRSGSAVAFSWDPKAGDPADAHSVGCLQANHFMSIERCVAEASTFGWVTAADPTGQEMTADDLPIGRHWRLQVRADVKKLPPSKLRMEVANAERQRGRRLSAKERRELKDHLEEQLLPAQLPRTAIADILVRDDLRMALLLSPSKAWAERLGRMVKMSFGFEPLRQGPAELAERLRGTLPASLAPEQWGSRLRQTMLPADHGWLGGEFLLWLWWATEEGGGEIPLSGTRTASIAVEGLVEFPGDGETLSSVTLRRGLTARSVEAIAALQDGRVPSRLRLLLAIGSDQWECTLGADLTLGAVRLPDDREDEHGADRDATRAADWFGLRQVVEEMFGVFLGDRLERWAEVRSQIAVWMGVSA